MHKLQLAVLVLVLIVGAAYSYTQTTGRPISSFFYSDYTVIQVGNVPIHVDIADTPEERARGLSGRESLKEGAPALLMIFDEPGFHPIWMKDMQFPIDIIWIGEDKKVIEITKNVLPESYPTIYEPSHPAKYVLETDILFAETFGITPGEELYLPEVFNVN